VSGRVFVVLVISILPLSSILIILLFYF